MTVTVSLSELGITPETDEDAKKSNADKDCEDAETCEVIVFTEDEAAAALSGTPVDFIEFTDAQALAVLGW